MTEEEWLICEDPEPMLVHLEGKVTDRQLRTFGVACVRRVFLLLRYERGRAAVELAERFARGEASDAELATAFASLTNIPVQSGGFINVPSPRWFIAEPSEPLLEYRGEPGDHGAMGAAWFVCAADARSCASSGSRCAADAVAEVAWNDAKDRLDWSDFREAHRRARAIEKAARATVRREQAALLRELMAKKSASHV